MGKPTSELEGPEPQLLPSEDMQSGFFTPLHWAPLPSLSERSHAWLVFHSVFPSIPCCNPGAKEYGGTMEGGPSVTVLGLVCVQDR